MTAPEEHTAAILQWMPLASYFLVTAAFVIAVRLASAVYVPRNDAITLGIVSAVPGSIFAMWVGHQVEIALTNHV